MLHRHLSEKKIPKPVVYIMDRGPWHTGFLIRQGPLLKNVIFSIPGWPEVNMIENSFSQIRDRFRSRPLFESLEDEVKFLVQTFASQEADDAFPGYTRNLLRTYLSKLMRYSFL